MPFTRYCLCIVIFAFLLLFILVQLEAVLFVVNVTM